MLIWYCRKTDRYFYNTPWKRHLQCQRVSFVREGKKHDRQRSKEHFTMQRHGNIRGCRYLREITMSARTAERD